MKQKITKALLSKVMAEAGRRGGAARAARMTKEERSAAAKLASLARWPKAKAETAS